MVPKRHRTNFDSRKLKTKRKFKLAKLQLGSTSDIRDNNHWRIMLYGANGSGKTHFAGTFPRPVFIVPDLGANEMRTLADEEFPKVSFSKISECAAQTLELCRTIKADKFVGPYKPRTIVIDNLSTMQTLFEYELKDVAIAPSDKHKMSWDDWAVIRHNVYQMLVLLHKLPVHIIWVAHAKIITVNTESGGQRTSISEGGFYLSGDTKNSVPANCDGILYADVIDRGAKRPGYYIHGQKYGIWPARVRQTPSMPLFGKIGPDPHYDDLAKILGLPSLEEEETNEFYKIK